MRWHALSHRTVIAAATVVMLLASVTIEPALAHAGHAHAENQDAGTVIFQVAGTAVALGVIALGANRVLRWRDDRRHEPDR